LTRLPATRQDAATRQIKGLPALRSGYWQDLTTADFGRVDPEQTVALLPVAAIEQHGPHLPLGVDAIINEALVRAALERAPVGAKLLVLPAQNVGLSPEHTSFAGTLSIRDATLLDAWTDIGRSVARSGVRKLIVLNTHGGQKTLVDLVAVRNKLLGAEKPVGIGWRAEDLNPAGACGNAAKADGRRGAQHLSYLADRLAALVAEVAATPLTILR